MAIETEQSTIAVVDDDPRIRESINNLLASAGFEARLFGSAEEILDTRELEIASCLITDVRMPGIDGWELQRRTVANFPLLPIVFITAHQDDIAAKHAFDLGAFSVLSKPFDGEELLEVVEAAVRQTKSAQTAHNSTYHVTSLKRTRP